MAEQLSKSQLASPLVEVTTFCKHVFASLPSRRVLLGDDHERRNGIFHQFPPTLFTEFVEDNFIGGTRRLADKVTK